MNAKSFEKVGMRTRVKNTPEMTNLILDDAIEAVRVELDKEGHTGKLGGSDGMLHFDLEKYKGFDVQIYGMKVYKSDLDVFGHWVYVGMATGKITLNGEEIELSYDSATGYPKGFETQRECGAYLYKLIDGTRGSK